MSPQQREAQRRADRASWKIVLNGLGILFILGCAVVMFLFLIGVLR